MLTKTINHNIKKHVIARNPVTLAELEKISKCEELAWKATLEFSNSSNILFPNQQVPEFVAMVVKSK